MKSIGYLLRRASKLALSAAEITFEGEELSFIQWIALIQLRDGNVDTCGGLARGLDHDTGATTRMLDQLEARGLVRRDRSPTDRRVIHLSLTPDGTAAAGRLEPRLAGLWRELLAGFADEEATMLEDLLKRLIVRLTAKTMEAGVR